MGKENAAFTLGEVGQHMEFPKGAITALAEAVHDEDEKVWKGKAVVTVLRKIAKFQGQNMLPAVGILTKALESRDWMVRGLALHWTGRRSPTHKAAGRCDYGTCGSGQEDRVEAVPRAKNGTCGWYPYRSCHIRLQEGKESSGFSSGRHSPAHNL